MEARSPSGSAFPSILQRPALLALGMAEFGAGDLHQVVGAPNEASRHPGDDGAVCRRHDRHVAGGIAGGGDDGGEVGFVLAELFADAMIFEGIEP